MSEIRKFPLVGKMPMPQKMNDFLVSGFSCEFANIITAIDELALEALDVAQAGAIGNDPF